MTARRSRERYGRRVLSEVVVTGRGRNPGGVGLNENTTRLVVCIPVLASPSCCNPIFYVCQDLLSVRPDYKSSVCFSEKHRGRKARVCGSEPCTRRFLPGHYLPPLSFVFRPGPPGRLPSGFTRNEHRYASGGGQISGMASPATTDHTW